MVQAHGDYIKLWGLTRGSIEDRGLDESLYRWLFEDVPLQNYYKEAATFAYNNLIRHREERRGQYWDESDPEWDTDDDEAACEGCCGYRNNDSFKGLPNIRLFHGLGGYKEPRWYFHSDSD